MRTTVTLEPDVHAYVTTLMRERSLSFEDAINFAVRQGFAQSRDRRTFRTPTYDLGPPLVPLDKALRLASELDKETAREHGLRK